MKNQKRKRTKAILQLLYPIVLPTRTTSSVKLASMKIAPKIMKLWKEMEVKVIYVITVWRRGLQPF